MFQCGTFLELFLYFFNLFYLIEFSWIIQIITASHSNNEKNEWKMIFILFSIMWGHIQEQTTNFEHLVHEIWPRTCGRVVFKFYKKQTKSENYETCQDVMISYVEAVIKFWGGFAQVVTYDACKPKNLRISFMISWRGRRGGKHRTWQTYAKPPQFFIIASTYDIITSWQVSRFSVFVCFL